MATRQGKGRSAYVMTFLLLFEDVENGWRGCRRRRRLNNGKAEYRKRESFSISFANKIDVFLVDSALRVRINLIKMLNQSNIHVPSSFLPATMRPARMPI
jgi:hypothetical protein